MTKITNNNISIIQQNLQTMMDERGYNMKQLSLDSGLNETAVRDIMRGRVANPTYHTLSSLARTLICTVAELTGEQDLKNALTNTRSINYQALIKAVNIIDDLINEEQLILKSTDKAKAYLACYEILALNKAINKKDITAVLHNSIVS
jgi:transcriptional regulator with XRE-family HTH domain